MFSETINTSDEENDNLFRAIALSLEGNDNVLETRVQEQEKLDMRKALALSLNKKVEELTPREILMMESSINTTTITTKRKASMSENNNSNTEGQNKAKEEKLPLKRTKIDSTSAVSNTTANYWDGIVKLTYIRGYFGPNFIRIEDIIQKSTLTKALITAFVFSKDFIEELIPSHVNLCIVAHGRPPMRKQIGPNRILICPPMKDDRYGVFHPKLMLLFHARYVRVVIGSANMESYDYNDLENVVFIQDFPLKPDESNNSKPAFLNDICDLLDKMQVPTSIKDELVKYDFAKAKAHIVASVSGVYEGEESYKKYGHTRLSSIINSVGADNPSHPPKVEMQTSSLGGLTVGYLNELYNSFCGVNPYASGKKSSVKKKQGLPPIDIIFPTEDTVVSSKLGRSGADTICLNTNTWRKPTFPKQIMCDAISLRPGTLMHSKYIIATLQNTDDDKKTKSKDQILGWLYCGSHNATTAAWGKLTLSRENKKPKMSISNWELGVVLPITSESDYPAPYLRPAPRYGPNQQAWTQDMGY
ncbi:unnamed protein product [Cunninghamella blakesleeana]